MTGAPLQRPSKAQFAAAALAMAVVVLASNILVQFPINDWLTWGAITYPVAFLVSELVNRAHGPAQARRVAWVGLPQPWRHRWCWRPARIAVASGTAFCCRNGWTLVCLTGCGMPPGGAPRWCATLLRCGAGHRRVLEHCLCGHRGSLGDLGAGRPGREAGLGVALLLPFRLFIGRQLALARRLTGFGATFTRTWLRGGRALVRPHRALS